MDNGHQAETPKDMLKAEREKLVVDLHMQGLDFDEIALRTGYYDRSGAYKAWKRALARIPVKSVIDDRKNAELRLAFALSKLWPSIEKGHGWAIDRLIAIETRLAAMKGLDAVKSDVPMQNVNRTYEIVRNNQP